MQTHPVPRRPSINDIAEAAEVSIATVSRVLNGSAYVKPAVSARVNAAVEALGYVKLRSSRKAPPGEPLVGLLLPDIENPFFAGIIKGVQETAATRDADILLADSGSEPRAVQARMARLVERGACALLVAAPGGYRPPLGNAFSLEGPKGRAVPVVFLDRRVGEEGFHYVGSENRDGAYNAAVYLGSLGHRDVLYLAGDEGLSTEAERYAGFTEGLAQAWPGRARPVAQGGRFFARCDFSLARARSAVAERLSGGPAFSAIFASDDYMAYGALEALREAGVRVPEDVSLIGFDDLPFSELLGLTSVRQQAFELGSAALALALDLLEGRRRGEQRVILSTSLVIRASCALRSVR